MSVLRGSAAVLAVNGHVYAIGGGGFRNGQSIIHASVEYAPIQPDGSLGSWSLTSPLKTRRVFAAAVSVNGFIY
ncbi:MAG: hypothetical protein ACE5FU_12900, partial [Nitrospinota bacterium]